MKDLIKKLVQNKGKQDDAIDLFAYERGLKDAIAALSNRPLTVIVPPIEWEQDPEDQRWWYGKDRDSKYSLKVFGNKIISRHGFDILFVELDNSMDDAKAVCQGHKQAIVDTALEGCNAVPYRDPQPLLDTLKFALPFIRAISSTMGDRNQLAKPSWYDVDESVSSMIQTWEEATLHKD